MSITTKPKSSLVLLPSKMSEIVNPPAKRKSPVWQYFGFPKVKEGDNTVTTDNATICRLCFNCLFIFQRFFI